MHGFEKGENARGNAWYPDGLSTHGGGHVSTLPGCTCMPLVLFTGNPGLSRRLAHGKVRRNIILPALDMRRRSAMQRNLIR